MSLYLFLRNLYIVLLLFGLAHFGYAQRKPEIAIPIPPQLPVIPEKIYKATDFGAKPNDGIDDTQAIQTAINTVSEKGGGRILFPDGTYDISVLKEATRQASNEVLTLQSKVALEAENSRKATIRLADNQPQYGTIFRWKQTGNADDVRIKGLVIDANGFNNRPKTYDDFKFMHDGKLVRWLPRFVLASRNGKRVHITDVHFTNILSINTINIGAAAGATGESLEKVSDVTIDNCLFDNVGWQEYDFDQSTAYTQADRFAITNCVFKSLNGAGTLSARCAIEIHGSDQIVKDNEIIGFTIGINVTGTKVLSHRQLIENNKFLDVARGIYLWSLQYKGHDIWENIPMLSDIIIRKNLVRISPDVWLATSRRHIKGIGTNPFIYKNSSSIENLLIEENTITTSGDEKTVQSVKLHANESAIGLHSAPMKNVFIINNEVGRNLGPSIGGDSAIDGLVIDNNKLIEPETAASSESKERVALHLTGEIKNATVTNNAISIDKAMTVKRGIIIKGSHKIEDNTINPSTISLQ